MQIGKVLVDEVAGVLKVIPYGIRAMRQHRRLPDARVRLGSTDRGGIDDVNENQGGSGVSIVRDVRYAGAERAVMDIYLPRGAALSDEVAGAPGAAAAADGRVTRNGGGGVVRARDADGEGLPVALFVHGGVWAVGEKWQFAPMASRLAEEGVVACVATYTLFPQANAKTMWREVSDAITWTLDNIRGFGGDPGRLTLMGHSAGAHICAMALLHRCGLAGRDDVMNVSAADERQPRQFIGMCGVYDVARHYDYEDSRGVALLSTMGRAMGGKENFAACSPLALVKHMPTAAERTRAQTARHALSPEEAEEAAVASVAAGGKATGVPSLASITQKLWPRSRTTEEDVSVADTSGAQTPPVAALASDTPPRDAASVDPPRRHRPSRASPGIPGPPIGRLAGDDPAVMAGYTRAKSGGDGAVGSTGAKPGSFPPTFLLAGCADHTVPWFETAEFHWALHEADIPSRVLLYLKQAHADFVLGWFPRKTNKGGRARAARRGVEDAPAMANVTPPNPSCVDGWNDGLDGEEDVHGLSPHCRDIVRLIKHV